MDALQWKVCLFADQTEVILDYSQFLTPNRSKNQPSFPPSLLNAAKM
jgi:hypothetical protein